MIDLKVVRLIPDAQGGFTETDVPKTLSDDGVVIIDVYGSLFYAGARTLQLRLPDPGNAQRAAVILRLRGRSTLGSTFLSMISPYAQRLETLDGHLYLTGLDDAVADNWESNHLPERIGSIKLYRSTPRIGESTRAALEDATHHLVRRAPDE